MFKGCCGGLAGQERTEIAERLITARQQRSSPVAVSIFSCSPDHSMNVALAHCSWGCYSGIIWKISGAWRELVCALLRPLNVGMMGNGFINESWGGWEHFEYPGKDH